MPTDAELRIRATVRDAVANLRTVRDEIKGVTDAAVQQAQTTVKANVKQRESIKATAAAYVDAAAQYKRGSAEQLEALKLAQKEFQRTGASAKEAAVMVAEAEREKQSWIERTTALLRGQAAAALSVGRAARRAGKESGAATAEARGERGFLGASSKEAGFGRILGGPAIIGGFIAGAGLAESIKLTLTAQQVIAQLRNSVRDAGQSWRVYRGRIEETIKAQERLSGFSREQLGGAMVSLIRRLGNVAKAQTAMGLATNLARGAHIGLDKAVTVITRAYQGNVGQLARLGIQIPKVTTHMDALREAHIRVTNANRAQVLALTRQAQALDKQATATEAVDQIERKYHDAAVTRSRTLQGQIDALRNRFRDWAVEVGTRAIPYAERFFAWLNRLFDAISRQHQALAVIKNILSAFVDGIKVAAGAVQRFWNTLSHGQRVLVVVGAAIAALTVIAMANPFIALVAGTIIAIGEIHKHWGAIKKWFENLWEQVKLVFEAFWDWIRTKAILAALDVVEPFSHLPGKLGHWARKAKDSMNAELDKIKADAAARGAAAGNAYGAAFAGSVAAQLARNGAVLTGKSPQSQQFLAPGPGMHPGETPIVTGGGNVQIPSSFRPTHQTAGLPGFPAVDIFSTPGTKVLAPEDGVIQDVHFIPWDIAKRIGGWTLYYQGATTGNTYFMTHLGTAARPGSYKKGAVIGTIAAVPGGAWQPHVHVGEHQGTYTPPGASTPPPPTPTTDTSFTDALASAAAAAGPAKPKRKTGLGAGAAATLRQTVGDLEQQVRGIFPASLRSDLEKRARDIMERIHKGLGPEAQAKLRSDLSKLRKDVAAALRLDDGVKTVRESVAKIRAQIQGWPARVRAPLEAQIRLLSRQLSNVMSPADLARARTRLKALQDSVKRALDEAKRAVAAARTVFEREWSRFSDAALSAFDKVTAATIRTQRITVQMGGYSFQYGQGALTPAQQALKDLQDQTAQQQRDQAIADASSQLAEAQAALAAGPTADKTLAELQAAVQDAQRQLDQAMLDQRESDLQKQADAEQAAADDQFQTWQDAYQEQRDAQRQALQDQLDTLKQNIEDQKTTWAQAMSDLQDILAAGGSDAANAFWTAYRAAEQAATGLAGAQGAQGALTGAGGTTDPGQGTAPDDRGGTRGAGGQGFLWGGIVWGPYDKASFAAWLAQHGANYATWAKNHPAAAATFLAKGGWVTSPTLAVMGEKRGAGEGVIPLDDPRALRAIGAAIASAGGFGDQLTVVFPNAIIPGRDRDAARRLARMTAPEIRRQIGYKSPV